MSAHTPGPWDYCNTRCGKNAWKVVGNSYQIVAELEWGDEKHQEANARLIAAAPELLEACKFAIECTNGGDFTMDGPNGKRTVRMGNILRAAIAKAEGRDA